VKAVSKDNVVDKIVVVLAIPRGGITFSHSSHPLHPVLMLTDFEKAIIYMVNPNPTKSNSKLHFVAILKVFSISNPSGCTPLLSLAIYI
jgi:hypothetical protein